MTVASHGTLRQRRERIAAVRASGVVLVALDLFQLGREADIPAACDGLTLSDLLRLALVDYRARYTDTRREDLIRCDLSKETLRRRSQRYDGFYHARTRKLVCLFCSVQLAHFASTQQARRICELMFIDEEESDTLLSPEFAIKLSIPGPAVWCVADVADAIRPHVVVCALTSLAAMQVPLRPGEVKREPADLPLFGEGG